MSQRLYYALAGVAALITVAVFALWAIQGAHFVTQYEVSYEAPIEDEFDDAFGDEDPFGDDDPFDDDDAFGDEDDDPFEEPPAADDEDEFDGPTKTVWEDEFRLGLMPDRGYDGALPLGGGFALLALIFLILGWRTSTPSSPSPPE